MNTQEKLDRISRIFNHFSLGSGGCRVTNALLHFEISRKYSTNKNKNFNPSVER